MKANYHSHQQIVAYNLALPLYSKVISVDYTRSNPMENDTHILLPVYCAMYSLQHDVHPKMQGRWHLEIRRRWLGPQTLGWCLVMQGGAYQVLSMM